MVLFTCRCLNITLHLAKPPSIQPVPSGTGWVAAETGEIEVGAGDLGVAGISVELPILANAVTYGKWTVMHCENCHMDVYAQSAEQETSKLLVAMNCVRGDDVPMLLKHPSYSPAFHLIVEDSEGLKDKEEPHEMKAMDTARKLQQLASDTLEKERIAMEERIVRFTKQQREAFDHLSEKLHADKKILTNKVVRLVRQRSQSVESKPGVAPSPLPVAVPAAATAAQPTDTAATVASAAAAAAAAAAPVATTTAAAAAAGEKAEAGALAGPPSVTESKRVSVAPASPLRASGVSQQLDAARSARTAAERIRGLAAEGGTRTVRRPLFNDAAAPAAAAAAPPTQPRSPGTQQSPRLAAVSSSTLFPHGGAAGSMSLSSGSAGAAAMMGRSAPPVSALSRQLAQDFAVFDLDEVESVAAELQALQDEPTGDEEPLEDDDTGNDDVIAVVKALERRKRAAGRAGTGSDSGSADDEETRNRAAAAMLATSVPVQIPGMQKMGSVLPRLRSKPLHEAVTDVESQEGDYLLSQSVPEKLRRAFYQPSI